MVTLEQPLLIGNGLASITVRATYSRAMTSFVYSVTMSADGFIAGEGGDMSWLTEFLGPNPLVDELRAEFGAMLIGRHTWEGDDPNRGREGAGMALGGGWEGPQLVVTRQPPEVTPEGITFVDNITTAVSAAREAAGGRNVNVLGATLARSCLDAGALDEVLTIVAPVLLGGGTRLFERPGEPAVQLERTHVSTAPLATNIRYRVLQERPSVRLT